VEYVEVRCIDLNPYEPLGINKEQMQVMDAFLLYCLLSESPETGEREFHQGQENQTRIVNNGREPDLALLRGDESVPMRSWANEILDGSFACAELLDQAKSGNAYRVAVEQQMAKVDNAELTPSAKVLRDMSAAQQSFYTHTLELAEQHRRYFAERPLAAAEQTAFEQMSDVSLQAQAVLEQQEQISFDQYLANYYAQYHNCSCAK
jgi:glutamate--cysteine ligase